MPRMDCAARNAVQTQKDSAEASSPNATLVLCVGIVTLTLHAGL